MMVNEQPSGVLRNTTYHHANLERLKHGSMTNDRHSGCSMDGTIKMIAHSIGQRRRDAHNGRVASSWRINYGWCDCEQTHACPSYAHIQVIILAIAQLVLL